MATNTAKINSFALGLQQALDEGRKERNDRLNAMIQSGAMVPGMAPGDQGTGGGGFGGMVKNVLRQGMGNLLGPQINPVGTTYAGGSPYRYVGGSEYGKLKALATARDEGLLPKNNFFGGGSVGSTATPTTGTRLFPQSGTLPSGNMNEMGVTSGKIDPMTGMMTPEVGQTPQAKIAQAVAQKTQENQLPLSGTERASYLAKMKAPEAGWFADTLGSADMTRMSNMTQGLDPSLQNMTPSQTISEMYRQVANGNVRPEDVLTHVQSAYGYSKVKQDPVTQKWYGQKQDGSIEEVQ